MSVLQPESLKYQLERLEVRLVSACLKAPDLLSPRELLRLRWAFSLARLTQVYSQRQQRAIPLGHVTDAYRQKLSELFSIEQPQAHVSEIWQLYVRERSDLLSLFADLSSEDLDRASRSRPLALALSGGGGTSYVFLGAFEALEAAGLRPSAIAATSMGSVLGAFRARYLRFSLERLERVFASVSLSQIVRPLPKFGRFGMPATFQLHLREVFASVFQDKGQSLTLADLPIPLRVTLAGISKDAPQKEQPQKEQLEEFAHLFDQSFNARQIKHHQASVTRRILELARSPLKAIYLGADDATRNFDVVDALSYSSSVPGVLSYDIFRDDPRMLDLMARTLTAHGVSRVLDGGLIDNLPSEQAYLAVQEQVPEVFDPFVLALDGFAPNLHHNWLFLPLMQFAAQTSKKGRKAAHHTLTFRHVLSPINIVPSRQELMRAIENGLKETLLHIPLIQQMVQPLPRLKE